MTLLTMLVLAAVVAVAAWAIRSKDHSRQPFAVVESARPASMSSARTAS